MALMMFARVRVPPITLPPPDLDPDPPPAAPPLLDLVSLVSPPDPPVPPDPPDPPDLSPVLCVCVIHVAAPSSPFHGSSGVNLALCFFSSVEYRILARSLLRLETRLPCQQLAPSLNPLSKGILAETVFLEPNMFRNYPSLCSAYLSLRLLPLYEDCSSQYKKCLPHYEACLHLIYFSFVERSKVMVVYNDLLYCLPWFWLQIKRHGYSFMEIFDYYSSPLDGKRCFAEICKSFGHWEDEINVLIQWPFAGCSWDFTLFRSKPSEDSLSSLQRLLQEGSALHLVLKDVFSTSYTLLQVSSVSDVLPLSLLLGTVLNEIAGIVHFVRCLVILFFSMFDYLIPALSVAVTLVMLSNYQYFISSFNIISVEFRGLLHVFSVLSVMIAFIFRFVLRFVLRFAVVASDLSASLALLSCFVNIFSIYGD